MASELGGPGSQGVPVTSAVRSSDGGGYAILFADGTVDAYGDFPRLGAPVQFAGEVYPANAIFADDSGGYWVTCANGTVYTYGDAPFDGSMLGEPLNGPIIAATGW
jgi:hypothetical protein